MDLPFLEIQKYHLSRDRARSVVISTLETAGVQRPPNGWNDLTINWNDPDVKLPVRFSDLVEDARRHGIVVNGQRYLDKRDSIFGGTVDEMGTPNWQMKIGRAYAGTKKEVQGPCRMAAVEFDLTEDILFYRREACRHSGQHDFRLTCRAFRSYLSACISIVDAFINRHVLLATYEGFSSPEFERLKVAKKLDERTRLWFAVCSQDDPQAFFESASWCHFSEIRTRRNEILHAVDPFGAYAIREMQILLNRVRTGVGDLLLRMRHAHKKPTLGFIERLRTAPLIDFMQITFNADGRHKTKRVVGK
jgi:hypothetical protein